MPLIMATASLPFINSFNWLAGTLAGMIIYAPFSMGPALYYPFFFDNLAAALIALSTGLTLIALTFNPPQKEMYRLVLMALLGALTLSFSALNMLLFYMSFELALIPTLFLITIWGSQPERLSASIFFLFYTFVFSMPMLSSLVYISSYMKMTNFSSPYLAPNFSFLLQMSTITALLAKVPLFSLHYWLPKAHVEASTPGSMMLAASLLKLGTYGLIRFTFITKNFNTQNSYISSLSLMGAMWASFICAFQTDIKAFIAYSSIAHMALIIIAILNSGQFALKGAIAMMLAHGLSAPLLFFMSNALYVRSHSRTLLINKSIMINMPGPNKLMLLAALAPNFSFPLTFNFLAEMALLTQMINLSLLMLAPIFFMCLILATSSLALFSYVSKGPYAPNLAMMPLSAMEMSCSGLMSTPLIAMFFLL